MKKFFVAITVLILIMAVPAFAAGKIAKPDKVTLEKNINRCEFNIKLLSNALELYANDHFSDYPEAKGFYSKNFNKYISVALGKEVADSSVFHNCGIAGTIKYKRAAKEKSYKLEIPYPEKLGLKALYYSSKDGYVKDDGSNKTAGNNASSSNGDNTEKVGQEEKKILTGIITDLFNAYANRDLEKVMFIEDEAICRSAKDMEARGKYKALEVYYAFKGTKNDVFRAEGFGMEPLNTQSLIFKRKGEQIIVSSPVPVIATKLVAVGTMKVRLRIAAFTFEKIDNEWKIVKMQMY
jgi:hypothetical protein